MDQNKLFKWATIILLIVNVALISSWLYSNSKGDGECRREQAHKKRNCEHKPKCNKEGCGKKDGGFFGQLNLDSTQHTAFREQAETYKTSIKEVRAEIKENMDLYFSSLKSTSEASDKEALMIKIQALQKKKIEMTYAHFESLKALLRDDQKENFDKHIDKAMKCILAKSSGDRDWRDFKGVCHKKRSSCDRKG